MSTLFAFKASEHTTSLVSEGYYDIHQQVWQGTEAAVAATGCFCTRPGLNCFTSLSACQQQETNIRNSSNVCLCGVCDYYSTYGRWCLSFQYLLDT